ncbi:MAG: DUF1629 domain-containing protein [Pseudomonadota bacterium]
MVWAIHQASGFGKYFLYGERVGWKEGLKAYWDAQEAQGKPVDRDYYDVSRKFTFDDGPLADVELVKEFRTEKGIKEIAAMAKTSNRLLIVHQALKELIEALEPDVHQFWPMKISMLRGKVFPKPYFGLRIGQFLNSFRPDESAEGSFDDRGSSYNSYDTKRDTAGLAFSGQVIAGKHLWREEKMRRPNIFMSDIMQQRAADAGLQLPKHFQAQVV